MGTRPRVMRSWAVFALLLLAAGCAATTDPRSGSPGASGTLVVTQEVDRGDSGAMYIEGYVPFLTLTRDGRQVFTERMRVDQPFYRDLPAGAYELTLEVHPCDANCGYLDPATETCSVSFSMAAGQTVRAHAVERPGANCSIRIGA